MNDHRNVLRAFSSRWTLARWAAAGLIAGALAGCEEKTEEFFLPLAFDGVDGTGTLEGTVRADDEGISGVTVGLQGDGVTRTTSTDGDGDYRFEMLPAASYALTISGFDGTRFVFDQTSRTVRVIAGETARVDFDGRRRPPTPDAIDARAFRLDAPKNDDSCPPGTFDDVIANPGPIPISSSIVNGTPFLTADSDGDPTGPYDPETGAWRGEGMRTFTSTDLGVVLSGGSAFVLGETIDGIFQFDAEDTIVLIGTLTFDILTVDLQPICSATYDATYTQLPG